MGSTLNDNDLVLLAMLERHEGRRNFLYDDYDGKALGRGTVLRGNATCGVGRNLSGVGLSDDEIEYLLRNDVARAIAALEHYPFFSKIAGARRDAVVDMMFNMGAGTFAKFTGFIGLMNDGNYKAASEDLLNSTAWAKQVPSRAMDDAMIIETGEYLCADQSTVRQT
jgi:GH24 family phage-related lysozyme (muramidase)